MKTAEEILKECKSQLIYLDERFGSVPSTEIMIMSIDNFLNQSHPTTLPSDEEINKEDWCSSGGMLGNAIKDYNSRLRDGQVETPEPKQEEVKEQTKNPSSKYYPLFKYFLDEYLVMLHETDCQEIEKLLNSQPALQPLPSADKLGYEIYNKSSLIDDLEHCIFLAEYIISKYGTQPREWWMDLKKGDKFMCDNGVDHDEKTFRGVIYLAAEQPEICDLSKCSPYTDPTQSFRSKLTPEMQVEFDKVVETINKK